MRAFSYLFDRRTSFFLMLCCLPLLFLPKINLLSLSKSETAGIRIDDVVLLVLTGVLFWAHVSLEKRLSSIERWVMAFVLWSLLSFGLNRVFFTLGWIPASASIFYCLRMLEYFIFFYIGMLSAPLISITTVIMSFFAWNTFVMVLQKFAIVGQFASSGYIPLANDRLAGIGSFPAETGMLLIMVFAFLLYAKRDRGIGGWIIFPGLSRTYQYIRIYVLFFVFAVLITLTGARIALAALVVIFGWKVMMEVKNGTRFARLIAVFFSILCVLVFALAIMHASKLIERSAGLASWRNVELVSKVWDRVDVNHSQDAQKEVKFSDYDKSWWMRIHKWTYALKMYVMHPMSYVQGVGPGFATPALDGGLLRVLTETGIVGCIIFAQMLIAIARLSKPLKWMVIGFVLNMIFFDVYLAYKPMSLLFFTAGSTLAANRVWEQRTELTGMRAIN